MLCNDSEILSLHRVTQLWNSIVSSSALWKSQGPRFNSQAICFVCTWSLHPVPFADYFEWKNPAEKGKDSCDVKGSPTSPIWNTHAIQNPRCTGRSTGPSGIRQSTSPTSTFSTATTLPSSRSSRPTSASTGLSDFNPLQCTFLPPFNW